SICDWVASTDTGLGTSDTPVSGTPSARSAPQILAQKSCATSLTPNTPIIGFAAWERNVAANPDASYGRIVAHSFVSGS
ncbi:MAG TPA: hypothetical protein DD491_06505, partial [Halieaceae bacterium]|nr:hypothetical protein [Halieaceae bacterium]